MGRRTDYVSFLGPPRDRNRDFTGLESRVALRVFIIPALIVSLVITSVYWYAFRDDNEDTGRVLTLADARIPSVLLPSGAATDDAGLLLAGVSIDCEEEITEWSAFQGSPTHQGCVTAPTISEDNATIEWQWTKREAVLDFRNPKKDATFFLDIDSPGGAFHGPQQIQVLLNDQPVEEFTLGVDERTLRRIGLKAGQMGTAEMAELRIRVDKPWVPAQVPEARNTDKRELGVRVFHAYVDPR